MLQEEKSSSTASTTASPKAGETTPRLSLFTFRTSETTTTKSTTTYRPQSLQELLGRGEEDTNTRAPPSEKPRQSFRPSSSLRSKLRKNSKPGQEAAEDKEHLEEGKKVPETNRISQSFSDRHKLKNIPIKNDDVTKFLPDDFKPGPSLNTNSDALLRELLSTLKEKDLNKLISPTSSESTSSSSTPKPSSNRFTPRAPGARRDFSKGYRKPSVTAVEIEDISKFLPADYSTEKPKLKINDLFTNIEVKSELPPSLLPKDYKPKTSKIPKLKTEEIPLSLLPKDYPIDALKVEPVELPASLLPKDYKKPKVVQEELPASLLPEGFNLSPQPVDPSLLPEGYDPSEFDVKQVEIPSELLPKDYKPASSDKLEPKEITDPSLLPPGFKLEPAEIDASLLPKGYKPGLSQPQPDKPVEEKKLIKLNFWYILFLNQIGRIQIFGMFCFEKSNSPFKKTKA